MLNLYNKGQTYKWRSVSDIFNWSWCYIEQPSIDTNTDGHKLLQYTHFSSFYIYEAVFVFFFLSGFSFKNIHDSHDIRGIHMTWYLFNSSSPLCRHLDTSRAITADSNREPLVAERKSLTTKPLSYVFSVLKWSRATTWQAKFLRKLFKR